jgi:hypothetical protein
MSTIDISDLPSWILVILMGLGLSWASSNGILTQYEGLGRLLVFGGVALGVFYFYKDISNKL